MDCGDVSMKYGFILFYCFAVKLITTAVSSFNDNPLLLIISFDGFRHDYINRNVTPTLISLRERSSYSTAMIPMFPSLTLTNHLTIATGLYPEVHGVLDNKVYIAKSKKVLQYGYELFHYNNNILPLWILNENMGNKRRSGCMLWPGSEFGYQGKYPTQSFVNVLATWESRVETLLSWYCDSSTPINLAVAHFEEPDSTCHRFGPDSEEVNKAIGRVDKIVQYLLKRTGEVGLLDKLNIILLSDHGCVHVHQPDYVIDLNDYVDKTMYAEAGEPPNKQIHPVKGKEAEVLKALRSASDEKGVNFTTFTRDEIPDSYHYKHCDRAPPILLRADLGYIIQENKSAEPGQHGYDPRYPEMWASFLATGPLIKKNVTIEPFQNIHIFPLAAHILQLSDPVVRPNGTLSALQSILNDI